MTARPGSTMRATVVGGCCVVAALSYSGAVTLLALLAFVLPAVAVVAAMTAASARLSLRLAATVGVGGALAIAEVVNLVSGTGNGPAARSTFVAAAVTALAVTAALGPAPTLFAAAVVGVVVGALGLGAGAEVAPVAVATAMVLVVALAVVEAQDRRWSRQPRQVVAVAAVFLVVGALAAAVALQADRTLEGDPAVLAPGSVQPEIQPPDVLGQRPESTTTAPDTSTPADEPPPSDETSSLRLVWLVVLAVVLAALLAVALRIVWVRLAWRALRRRLRRGPAADQVAGAWVWATRRLRSAGWQMPLSLSADTVSAGHGVSGLPRAVRAPLRQVATATVDALYAPAGEDDDPVTAWAAADEVARGALGALGPAQGLGFALRGITSVPSHPATQPPTTIEENRS